MLDLIRWKDEALYRVDVKRKKDFIALYTNIDLVIIHYTIYILILLVGVIIIKTKDMMIIDEDEYQYARNGMMYEYLLMICINHI